MTFNHQVTDNVDIVIVGGGIVGLTLANSLADTDFSVAVVEKNEPPAIPEGDSTDLRVSAINPAATSLFHETGVWPHLGERYCAYDQMHVWDTTGLGQIHFDAADLGVAELGHIIENSVLVHAQLSALKKADNICLHCPQGVESICETDDRKRSHTVTLQNGQVLNASLIVAADGARSFVRDVAGLDFTQSSYHQQGLVCSVSTEESHQHTAWQCFLPSGPLAFLPLFNGQSSIVWSLDDDRAREIIEIDDDCFRQELAQASEYQLGEILSVSERRLFPLSHGHANQYVKHGLALIGDAAHTIHPLAGQGANLGIADARCLAEVIQHAKAGGRQWYATHTLLKYQRQRKAENRIMETAMTGFKTLFGEENPLLAEVRNAGLNMVDQISIVKNRFIRHAMGE